MGSRRRRVLVTASTALLCVASTALLLGGCGRGERPNFVLITLDTTRADRLGAYGYAAARTPNFDRFARTATLYENAYATASWTLPSHASILTGLLPMQHGAQAAGREPVGRLAYGVRPLAERFETLAEILRRHGYRTAAVVAGPALGHELGVAQGFDVYDDDLGDGARAFTGRRAQEVADAAIRLVQGFGVQPFFLFVNFFDPHAPYRPPPPFDRGLPPDDDPELGAALVARLEAGEPPLPPDALPERERAALDAMRRGYDAELAYLDVHLGRLLDAIDAAPRGRRTLVAITSDHGESFGEHYYLSHGAHLYEDNVRVPLVVRMPGRAGAGRRVANPVQNHQLFTTLLDGARLPRPSTVDVRPLDDPLGEIVTEVQRSSANVQLFGELFARDLRAVYQPPYKLIESSRGGFQLYDLERDPEELRDLAESEVPRRKALAARLQQIAAVRPPLYDADERAELRPETEEALRALGYLE